MFRGIDSEPVCACDQLLLCNILYHQNFESWKFGRYVQRGTECQRGSHMFLSDLLLSIIYAGCPTINVTLSGFRGTKPARMKIAAYFHMHALLHAGHKRAVQHTRQQIVQHLQAGPRPGRSDALY